MEGASGWSQAPPSAAKRWAESTKMLFEAINMSMRIKSGARQLKEAVLNALALVVPAPLVGELSKGVLAADVASPGNLPSDATVRRGEFSLDAAISLLRRRRYSSTCCRYLWSDSSPVARHDWVWMQCHEIEHSNLVSTCRAVRDLIRLVRSFADIQAQWPQFDVDGVEAEDAWN